MSINVTSQFNEIAPIALDTRAVAGSGLFFTSHTAIPSGQRYVGLQCYDTATGLNYQLQGGIADINWVVISAGTVTGTGTSGQVAYFNGTGSITSNANLLYDGTNLTIGNQLLFANTPAPPFASAVFGIGYTAVGNEIHSDNVANGIFITGNNGGSDLQLFQLNFKNYGAGGNYASIVLAEEAPGTGMAFQQPVAIAANHYFNFVYDNTPILQLNGVGNGTTVVSGQVIIAAGGLNTDFKMFDKSATVLFNFDGNNKQATFGHNTLPGSINYDFASSFSTTAPTIGNNYYGSYFGALVTTPASGSPSIYATNYIDTIVQSGGGGASIGIATNLYINAAPTIGGANYSAYIDGATACQNIISNFTTVASSASEYSNTFVISSGSGAGTYSSISNVIDLANGADNSKNVYGINQIINIANTFTMSGNVIGFNSVLNTTSSAGSFASMTGFNSSIVAGSGNVANIYDFYAGNGGGSASLTTHIGLFIENLTGAVNNYGIFITGASTRAIKVAAGISEFDEQVQIIGQTAGNASLVVQGAPSQSVDIFDVQQTGGVINFRVTETGSVICGNNVTVPTGVNYATFGTATAILTFAAGGVPSTEANVFFGQPSYASVDGGQTISSAWNVSIELPLEGTNVTFGQAAGLSVGSAAAYPTSANAIVSNIVSGPSLITYPGEGTITNIQCGIYVDQLTLTSSQAVFATAASIYIKGAPQQGGSLSLSHSYSIWADDGLARFDAGVDVSNVPAADTTMYFTSTSNSPSTTWTGGVPSNNPTEFIQLQVNGATRYFPVFT